MSIRRLKVVKTCAVCAQSFRPHHRTQWTCSQVCGAIRRVRMYPHHYQQMIAANRANKAQHDAQLAETLKGLSLTESYARGHKTGYRSGYQAAMRAARRGEDRRIA